MSHTQDISSLLFALGMLFLLSSFLAGCSATPNAEYAVAYSNAKRECGARLVDLRDAHPWIDNNTGGYFLEGCMRNKGYRL